jgi:hypothetical protein
LEDAGCKNAKYMMEREGVQESDVNECGAGPVLEEDEHERRCASLGINGKRCMGWRDQWPVLLYTVCAGLLHVCQHPDF